MPRGIQWDELPNNFAPPRKKEDAPMKEPVAQEHSAKKEIDLASDSLAVGKRFAFGAICGGLTGACFGFVDVLKNPKMLAGKTMEGRKKVIGFTGQFAGFFGGYHATRKLLHLYVPLSPEMNVAAAAAISFAPMLVVPRIRHLFPYGVVMIALDAFNGLDDL